VFNVEKGRVKKNPYYRPAYDWLDGDSSSLVGETWRGKDNPVNVSWVNVLLQ
jgi:hypothetical protein